MFVLTVSAIVFFVSKKSLILDQTPLTLLFSSKSFVSINLLHELLTHQIVALWQCAKTGRPGQTPPLPPFPLRPKPARAPGNEL
jgi:hypothetical protein